MPAQRDSTPVFLDSSGRRWRRVRLSVAVAAVVSTVLAGYLVAGILIPPLLPAWVLPHASAHALNTASAQRQSASTAKRASLRTQAKKRLFATLPSLTKPASTPIAHTASRRGVLNEPITAAFYVNWDEDAFTSLAAHAHQLDWLIGEWGFIRSANAPLTSRVDARALALIDSLPVAQRPRVLAMITNVDSGGSTFSGSHIAQLLANDSARTRFIRDAVTMVHSNHLGGVVIDFEEVPVSATNAMAALLDSLRVALHPAGGVVAVTIAAEADSNTVRSWSAASDMVIPMLYDEHSGEGTAGPVAGQQWYTQAAARFAAMVPPDHLLMAFGSFGYDWTDEVPHRHADAVTYAEAMNAARLHHVSPAWDASTLQPFITWTDPDSTDHAIWYLDAITSWNALRATSALGVAGHVLWRLGAEDPSLWRVFGRGARTYDWSSLQQQPAGYGVDIRGDGELLRVTSHPTSGARVVTYDSAADLITAVHTDRLPSPWTVERTGAEHPHRVALTFDDGPDGTFTAPLLDTLRSRHAVATFFVIGEQVQRHLALTRRIVAEGHTIGSHTFSHPDLSRVTPFATRLELDATARLLEAVLGTRIVLFRPPYFGDAEPTTEAELAPVEQATQLGYLTAGVHVDSDDWRRPGTAAILARTLAARARGQVILLHDGGGDRSQTLAAVGPLIDSLRARGDTIVPLGALADVSPAQIAPPLDHEGMDRRWLTLAGYGGIGALQWSVGTMLTLAVVIGAVRLLLVLAFAMRHRFRRSPTPRAFAPGVSVIVPAYKEEAVVVATVRSLLAQRYDGALEVIVVDDGSPDDTYAIASRTFAGDERVNVITKPNGGKASALNHGLAQARYEYVVALDADTVFAPDAIATLMLPLHDGTVGAVAGNAKVGNRINMVTKWQALEYITCQNLDRRAFAMCNAMTVVPGAVGAWRVSAVREAGGFSHDTLAEDQDLTIALRRNGWRIAYAADAVAWTEAPDTLRALAKQRFRWSFGTLQCAWKHRDTLLRTKYGTLGWIAMPNTWIFQLFLTALSPLADLLFVYSIVQLWIIGQTHGLTYARTELAHLSWLYALYTLVDVGVGLAAIQLEPGEDRRLAWYVVLQRFAYRQVMYVVVLRAVLAAIRGRLVGWGSLERKATVLPSMRHLAAAALVVGMLAVRPVSAQTLPATLADLPVTEVPARTGNTLAIYWSGDGGWAELVQSVSKELANKGIAVVGINSRSWLSDTRTPDDAARDTERLLRTYLAKWSRSRVVLLGYSRGSGFLPFIVNRLPADLRQRIDLVGMMGAEQSASFEFHLADLVRSTNRPTDLPVIPELRKAGNIQTLCIYGTRETDTICPQLDATRVVVVSRVGDHHFDRNYPAIAQTILSALPKPPVSK